MLLSGNLNGLQHIGIPTGDIEKTKNWYTGILGFKVVHEKNIVVHDEDISAAFLQLGDIIVETYQPSIPNTDVKSHGYIDHFAIYINDIDAFYAECVSKGVLIDSSTKDGPVFSKYTEGKKFKFLCILGPNGERIELNQCLGDKNSVRGSNFTRLSHLGLYTDNIEESIRFYTNLGFRNVLNTYSEDSENDVKSAVMEKDSMQIELCRYARDFSECKKCKGNGSIDHIALDVNDIEKAYSEVITLGIEVLEDGLTFLPFWQNGVKFFTIRGPGNEKIEFNQKL